MKEIIERLQELAGINLTENKKQLHMWVNDYHDLDDSGFEEVDLEAFGYHHNKKNVLSYLGLSKNLSTKSQQTAYLTSIESELTKRGFVK